MQMCQSSKGRAPVARRGGQRLLALMPVALVWACADSPTGAEFEGEMAELKDRSVEVWSPTEGARLSGPQTFMARATNVQPDNYTVTWQVDGREPQPMVGSNEGGAHKRATVDVSTFDWNGSGPYELTFTALSLRGQVLARRTVSIMTQREATTPPPTTQPSTSPFAGAKLWVNPDSRAQRTADQWRATRPSDAAQLEKVAVQPEVTWFNGWHPDVRSAVAAQTAKVVAAGALPVYVAYNIPVRDCNSYSAGGATSAAAYRAWIRDFVAGLGSAQVVVVLEPDALAGASCLTEALRQERFALIADAVNVIRAQGSHVYIDAGNSNWISAATMATRLQASNIANADGFALNVSNFMTTSSNVAYGTTLSGLVGGKHFIVDTSRNGLGPTADYQWCNPEGRALGAAPTTNTGHPLVDALLWIKKPGESDGTCNGGPNSGAWWPEYALGLARRT